MSCNTLLPMSTIVTEVEALLSANYIDKDDPRITNGVFTEPTFRGGFILDADAKLTFCGLVHDCGLQAPFGKQWVDRPLYPDTTLVSYEDAGEVKTRWEDTDDFISGLVTDTRVTTVPLPGARGMIPRKQSDVNAERISVHDFGAIGDGTLHTVAEWTVVGSRIYFPDLAAIQAVYPHVTALTDSVDWAAIQACINYAKTTDKTVYGVSGKTYYINKQIDLEVDAVFSGSTFLVPNDYVGKVISISAATEGKDLVSRYDIKLPNILNTRPLGTAFSESTGVYLQGVRNCSIVFDGVNGFKTNIHLYSSNTNSYIAYNEFRFIGTVAKSMTNVWLQVIEGGWINQCQWWGGQFAAYGADKAVFPNIVNLRISKTLGSNNAPNAHTFWGCSMEGSFYRTIEYDYDPLITTTFFSTNAWVNCRFEGALEFKFASVALYDRFDGCYLDPNVVFVDNIRPDMVGTTRAGIRTLDAAPVTGVTRSSRNTNVYRASNNNSAMVLATSMTSSDTINCGITAGGSINTFHPTDHTKIHPTLSIAYSGGQQSLQMGSGDTAATDKLYYYSAGDWRHNFGLRPNADNTISLGSNALAYKEIFTNKLSVKGGLGVFGTAPPSTKPKVSGVVGNPTALTSLLSALGAYGLVDDETTVPSAVKGSTELRPVDNNYIGQIYLDTTLAPDGKPIWWNGSAWVDALGVIA